MTVTPNTDPVFNIEQGEYVAPIGAMAENVYINIGSTTTPAYITLQDFYNEWKSFKEQAKFIQYGISGPNSENVKVWYDARKRDLTNTVWLLNETLNLSGTTSSMINFTDNESTLYNKMGPNLPHDNWRYIYDALATTVYTSNNGWESENYRTITITGGEDATNSNLIDWLYNNATLIED